VSNKLILAIVSSSATFVVLSFLILKLRSRVRVVRALTFPLIVGALAIAVRVVTLFDVIPEMKSNLPWVVAFLISVAFIRIVGLYFFDVYLHSHRGVRLPPLLPNVALGACYLVVALIVLKATGILSDLGPIFATSAITSLVLGLALQPILGNFFSGLVISLEKPFRINDWIHFEDTEARVVDITWRTTHLRTRDNDNLVVPNSQIAGQQILNYFYPHPLHLERIQVGVHYSTPPYRVKQALLDAADRTEGVLEKPSPEVYLLEFGDSSINYELRIWIEDIAHRPRIGSHCRSEIWEEFRRRHITIPYPIRTLEIEPKANSLTLERPSERTRGEGEPAEARLYVARGQDRGEARTLLGGTLTVGRSGSSDLVLSEPICSKEHLRIEWRESDSRYVAKDLGSSNGTHINGVAIDEKPLNDFDRIEIGDSVIVFEQEK